MLLARTHSGRSALHDCPSSIIELTTRAPQLAFWLVWPIAADLGNARSGTRSNRRWRALVDRARARRRGRGARRSLANALFAWRRRSASERDRRGGPHARDDAAAATRGARTIRIRAGRPRRALVEGDVAARDGAVLAQTARHMLRLDADLSGFYDAAREDPTSPGPARRRPDAAQPDGLRGRGQDDLHDELRLVGHGRMATALVSELGAEAPDGRRAFLSPEAMAEASEDFYKDVVRAGYRGPYLRGIAADVAEGSSTSSAQRPRATRRRGRRAPARAPGCGPDATAHMMMLLGRNSRLILDSWTRPKYARLNGRKASDRTIERRFRRYGDHAGLAFWLYLTRDWVDEPAATIVPNESSSAGSRRSGGSPPPSPHYAAGAAVAVSYQAVPVGPAARLGSIRDIQLPIDVRQVELHRLLCHPEHPCELAIRVALRNERENLPLTPA